MKHHASATLVVVLFATACGGEAVSTPAPAPAPLAPDAPLGSIEGDPIRFQDLPAAAKRRLADVDNEAQQRQFHLLWAGVEETIAERLIAREAAKRGISSEDLRKLEVDGKVSAPTDDEIQRVYEENKQVIDVPLEIAAPHIKTEMMNERRADQERALVDRLRDGANVRYSIPAPVLPRLLVPIGDAPTLGPENAKVTVVAFSDFQCPYCARARNVLKHLMELYPKDVRLVFRDFPLGQHKDARRAAEAARCAHEQSKFWQYHDLLFDHPSALGESDLKRYANEAKLDLQAFDSCVASTRPKEAVAKSEADARLVGVEGTPSIYINGMKLIGLLPLPLLKTMIDHELVN